MKATSRSSGQLSAIWEDIIKRPLTDATVVLWKLGVKPDMVSNLPPNLRVSLVRNTISQSQGSELSILHMVSDRLQVSFRAEANLLVWVVLPRFDNLPLFQLGCSHPECIAASVYSFRIQYSPSSCKKALGHVLRHAQATATHTVTSFSSMTLRISLL